MTLDQFLQFLRSQKLERAAELVAKYPDVVEPFLPKIAERLRAKGLIEDQSPREAFYAAVLAVLPESPTFQKMPAVVQERIRRAIADAGMAA